MHSRTLLRRLAGTTVALVLLTGLLAGTSVAKPPDYGQADSATPAEFVSYGGQVRFDVAWTNLSGANLPTVFTKAVTPDGADLVAVLSQSQGECGEDLDGNLSCDFGTVNAGVTVDLAVVYRVPTSGPDSFSVTFVFTAQGDTGSDKPGKSRGDDMPITASVDLTNDPDEGGTYVYGDVTTLQNNQSLSKQRNPQSARLDFAGNDDEDGFGATLDELGATTYECPGVTTCYGLWNVVSVSEADGVPGGFETVLGYFSVPSNAVGGFVHWLVTPNVDDPDGEFELIDEACDYDDGVVTNMPCIADVAKIQGNTFFTILSETNGPMRGY
jgi:hypothetical protein